MQSCPRGGILLHRELALLDEALEWAIDNIRITIDSDHVTNPKFRTLEDARQERVRKKVLRDYERLQRKFKRIGANRVLLANDLRRPPR